MAAGDWGAERSTGNLGPKGADQLSPKLDSVRSRCSWAALPRSCRSWQSAAVQLL